MVEFRIITRKEALQKNLPQYFTGKPCKHGHVAERDTVNGTCVVCRIILNRKLGKIYRINNKEKLRLKVKAYYAKNKDKLKALSKANYAKEKEKWKLYGEAYYAKHKKEKRLNNKIYIEKIKNDPVLNKKFKEKKAIADKKYREKNREKINLQQRIYIKKPEIRKKRNENHRKRYNNEPSYKIEFILRARLRELIKRQKMKKPSMSLTKFQKEFLGTSDKAFVKYLEKKFYPHPKTGEPMSWENHSLYGWHIDHIKPVSEFDLLKIEDQKKCFHYKNFQPLWAEENLEKRFK